MQSAEDRIGTDCIGFPVAPHGRCKSCGRPPGSRIIQRNPGRNGHPCLASPEVGLASGYDSSPSLTGHNRPWPVVVSGHSHRRR